MLFLQNDYTHPLDETAIWLQPICLSNPSGEGCDDRIKKRNLIQFEVYPINSMEKIDQLIELAEKAASEDAWPEAVKLWTTLLQNYKDKTPATVYVRLSLAYRKLKLFKDAQNTVDLAIARYGPSESLAVEIAEIATGEGNWRLAQQRWEGLLSTHNKVAPDLWRERLREVYLRQGLMDEADEIITPKYAEEMRRLERDIEQSGILGSKLPVTVVVVPQKELSPYVAGILRMIGNTLKGNFLVVYRPENPMSRDMLIYSARCHGLDYKLFHHWAKKKVEHFKAQLDANGIKVATLVVHPFERVNSFIVKAFLDHLFSMDSSVPMLIFYSDGSRNNKESEWDYERKGAAFCQAIENQINVWLCEFGFSTPSKLLDQHSLVPKRKLLVGYEWIDFCYEVSASQFQISSNYLKSMNSTDFFLNSMLILSRYWGRDPYFFQNDQMLMKAMAKSIEKAGQAFPHFIFRKDVRSQYDFKNLKKEIEELKPEKYFHLIEDIIISNNGRLDDFLFEGIMHKTAEFIEHIQCIYCFDSSFPLVFLSPGLMKRLHPNIEIIVGFDFESVNLYGKKKCLDVMAYRTAVLVEDILNIGLFCVSDELGPVSKDATSTNSINAEGNPSLLDRIRLNGGYFTLRKNNLAQTHV